MLQKLISFFLSIISFFAGLFNISPNGYNEKALFADTSFENGFSVVSQGEGYQKLGDFVYSENGKSPVWCIAQWGQGDCLWANRTASDVYTVTDGKTKTVTYNNDEKSVLMRLNAANIYGGKPADMNNWPHLLLEQTLSCGYNELNDTDKQFYSCSVDKLMLNLKIKLSDFVDTVNSEGVNAAEYLAYFYLSGVDSDNFIWFGLNLFDSRGYRNTRWSYDESSGKMIYCVSTEDTYGSKKSSLFRNGQPFVSDEWINVEIDLIPHIKKALAKANFSHTFEKSVKASDFYISGMNIGFEIHGNYDCTVQIKDFSLISYVAA